MRNTTALLLILTSGFVACDRGTSWNGSLAEFLEANGDRLGPAMQDPAAHRVQVIYTQIDRDDEGYPSFTSFTYRLDGGEYFYPASTVKLPVAALALEKLKRLDINGLDRDTPMLTGAADSVQTAVISDPSATNGLPSVGHYVRKILLVSDNDAYNRLYEFLGPDEINVTLRNRGYAATRIMHRLEIVLPLDANRHTNPIVFVRDGGAIYEQSAVVSNHSWVANDPIPLGSAEIVAGERLARPKDFAEKNAYPLQAQHDLVQALMFPNAVPEQQRFHIDEDDLDFLWHNMSSYPGDSGIREYEDEATYPDGYVKFLMFGADATTIPDNIRIFNKVGNAYGFLTDVAYIVDLDAGVEFLLAATVYSNANATFNDNEYEYEEIGLPFLRALGQLIYEVELSRDKAVTPETCPVAPPRIVREPLAGIRK